MFHVILGNDTSRGRAFPVKTYSSYSLSTFLRLNVIDEIVCSSLCLLQADVTRLLSMVRLSWSSNWVFVDMSLIMSRSGSEYRWCDIS